MSSALAAIGGAIDRATLALLWLGRSVFVVTAVSGAACTTGAAYTWWNAPTVTFTPVEHISFADKIDRNIKRLIDQGAPDEHLQAYIDSEGVTLEQVVAHRQAKISAKDQIIRKHKAHVEQHLGAALAFFLVGAIVLGLTRVTRWIVVGR